jgi:16S rRNA C967 or C1407 C5-methylase (RsmB/RsmF family)
MSEKGLQGFESHYSSVYGERWPALKAALLAPVRQVARLNKFAMHDTLKENASESFAGSQAYVLDGEKRQTQWFESRDALGLSRYYVMDPASIFAAVALEAKPGDEVLDLCSAPGGKSLILAESLGGAAGSQLTCNEMSDRRRGRLRAVLEDYLPKETLEHVRVAGHDGARWCLHETDAFDRILVDAPCSGERHLLENADEIKLWSKARSKNLAVRQYALLASALAVVRPGGRIVYSTCSISPLENDAVIARLLKKRAGEASVRPLSFALGEATEHGWMILPDRTGYGPIYIAALEKTVSD